MRAGDLLDDRAADAPDRDAAPVLRGSDCRRGADVVLDDSATGAASAEPHQLDAELLRQLPDGRSCTDCRRRVRRDDRDERLAGGLAPRLRAGVHGTQELLARVADHHEHSADRRDVALTDEDLEHRPGAR